MAVHFKYLGTRMGLKSTNPDKFMNKIPTLHARGLFPIALPALFLVFLPGLPQQSRAQQGQPTPSVGKEIDVTTPSAWVSAPFEFLDGQQRDMARVSKGEKRLDWVMPPVSLENLQAGVKLTKDSAGSGVLLEWRNHHKYPTIATRRVPPDWSSYAAISIKCYSRKATGEVITLGVLADNPATPYQDYWTRDIPIDWTGWKQITLNLDDFEKIGEPTGWSGISGLYFFSKAKRRSPNPSTVLYFSNLLLLPGGGAQASAKAPGTQNPDDIVLTGPEARAYPVLLNHDDPELTSNLVPGTPLVHQAYFSGARALYGYNPRYNPGYVSFDPKGRAYVRSINSIDWLDAEGQWHQNDLSAAIKDYARKKGWKIVICGEPEPMIRFDRDGDVYAIVNVEPLKRLPNGSFGSIDWHYRSSLLLHARDITQPWTVQLLPGRTADFEKIDTFNQDALNHPPVITLSDYNYFQDADHAGYLVVPEKQADGSLLIPPPVKFASFVLIGPVHSGGGNFIISKGDKIYVVYAYAPAPAKGVGNGQMRMKSEQWLRELPPIPEDNPARLLTDPQKDKEGNLKTNPATDGMPTFVVAYDRVQKKFGPPAFVGYGGHSMDDHDWPAMTMDSKGNLHVVMNGHIQPLMYTHTITPGDITRWSPAVYVKSGPAVSRVSYASLNCDKDDNLISVVRSDTGFYNHRLAVLSKPANSETWNPEHSLVVPYRDNYHVWAHRVTLNPRNNRLFVAYCEQSGQQFLTRDGYFFCRFIWPDYEKPMTSQVGKDTPELDNKGPLPDAAASTMYATGLADLNVLVSDDGGKTWRIATTPDFQTR